MKGYNMRFMPVILGFSIFLSSAAWAQTTADFERQRQLMNSERQGIPTDEYNNIPPGLLAPPDIGKKKEVSEQTEEEAMRLASSKMNYDEALAKYKKGDFNDVVKNLEPLAQSGHTGAQELLGVMYRMGQGVPKDVGRAFTLLTNAAQDSRPLAQHHLGSMYYLGEGTPSNPVEAMMWMELAIIYYADGPEKAQAEMDRSVLEKALSRRDRDAALQKAREWLAKKGEIHLLEDTPKQ